MAEKRVGRTSVIFTKKALTHVLEQHSEEKGTEKARMLKRALNKAFRVFREAFFLIKIREGKLKKLFRKLLEINFLLRNLFNL